MENSRFAAAVPALDAVDAACEKRGLNVNNPSAQRGWAIDAHFTPWFKATFPASATRGRFWFWDRYNEFVAERKRRNSAKTRRDALKNARNEPAKPRGRPKKPVENTQTASKNPRGRPKKPLETYADELVLLASKTRSGAKTDLAHAAKRCASIAQSLRSLAASP